MDRDDFGPEVFAELRSDAPVPLVGEPAIQDDRCRVVIQFEDGSGNALPNFGFKWAEVGPIQRRELLRAKGPGTFSPSNAATADQEGRWTILCNPDTTVVITASDSSYAPLNAPVAPLSFVLQPLGAHCIPVPLPSADAVEVVSAWSTTLTVYVRCIYEDGQAFAGQVAWGLRQLQSGKAVRLLASDQHAECPALIAVSGLVGTSLVVNVRSDRIGFKAAAKLELELTAPVHLRLFTLTIPVDESRTSISLIEIDCSELPEHSQVTVQIMNLAGLSVSKHSVLGPTIVVSKDLTHLGSEFVVQASGDFSWLSERISLASGETKRVTLRVSLVGAVKARVIDANGTPLAGARLLPVALSGGGWDVRGPKRGGVRKAQPLIAYSDESGNVVLPGISAGEQTLVFEASNHKPVSRKLDVPVNAVEDIGDIVLEMASGSVQITIRIEDGVDPSDFYVHLHILGGGKLTSAGAQQMGSDGKLTLANLPEGDFAVLITKGRDGGGWAKRVSITEGELSQVSIDTTLPKGSQTGK